MRINLKFLVFVGCLVLLKQVALAVEISTEPVGVFLKTIKGASDSGLSVPLSRAAIHQGLIQSVTSNVIAVQGSPNWSTSPKAFVYSAPAQREHYYLIITSGPKEGMWFDITDNSSNTVTLDLAGATLSPDVTTGTSYKIVPHWTLNTVFPEGSGTHVSTDGSPVTIIYLQNSTTAGVNLAPTMGYFYYFGGAADPFNGWYKTIGEDWSAKSDDVVLVPDSYVTLRHPVSKADTSVTVSGIVGLNKFSTVIGTYANSVAQDNFVAVPCPVDVKLSQLGLVNSDGTGSFKASTDGSPADILYLFDDSATGMNKAPVMGYFYYFGGVADPFNGWYKTIGEDWSAKSDNVVLKAGSALLIRKAPTPSASTSVWTFTPPF